MARSVPGPALPPHPGTLLDQGLGKPQEGIVSAVHGAPYRSPSIIRRSITVKQRKLKGGCPPLSPAADEAGVFPHPLCGDTPQRPGYGNAASLGRLPVRLAPSHIATAEASSAAAVTVQSMETVTLFHPSHRPLENAGDAGVYHSRARPRRRSLGQEQGQKRRAKAKAYLVKWKEEGANPL